MLITSLLWLVNLPVNTDIYTQWFRMGQSIDVHSFCVTFKSIIRWCERSELRWEAVGQAMPFCFSISSSSGLKPCWAELEWTTSWAWFHGDVPSRSYKKLWEILCVSQGIRGALLAAIHQYCRKKAYKSVRWTAADGRHFYCTSLAPIQ